MAEQRLIPLAAMEKILKKAGAKRISDNAKMELKRRIENIGEDIAQKAIKLARHSGRKTIRDEDIKIAIKDYKIQG